ncbi:MAG: hypothetical protein VYA97_11735, partial [Pseudomonadota bacterium]|nr:hypothetical protein [Pseudomonadota bacterium]
MGHIVLKGEEIRLDGFIRQVLQAGGLPLDSLNRVETIELWKDDTPYRINRFDLSVDQASSWPA